LPFSKVRHEKKFHTAEINQLKNASVQENQEQQLVQLNENRTEIELLSNQPNSIEQQQQQQLSCNQKIMKQNKKILLNQKKLLNKQESIGFKNISVNPKFNYAKLTKNEKGSVQGISWKKLIVEYPLLGKIENRIFNLKMSAFPKKVKTQMKQKKIAGDAERFKTHDLKSMLGKYVKFIQLCEVGYKKQSYEIFFCPARLTAFADWMAIEKYKPSSILHHLKILDRMKKYLVAEPNLHYLEAHASIFHVTMKDLRAQWKTRRNVQQSERLTFQELVAQKKMLSCEQLRHLYVICLELISLVMSNKGPGLTLEIITGTMIIIILMGLVGVRKQVITNMQIVNIHWSPEEQLYRYHVSSEKVKRYGNEIPLPNYLNTIIKWYIETYWPSIPKKKGIIGFFISAKGYSASGATILNRVKTFIAKLFPGVDVSVLDFRRMFATLAMKNLRVKDTNGTPNLFITTLANLMNCTTKILMEHYVREVPVRSLTDVQNIVHETIFGSQASDDILKNMKKYHGTPEKQSENEVYKGKMGKIQALDEEIDALKRTKETLHDEAQDVLHIKQIFPKVNILELFGSSKEKKVIKKVKPGKITIRDDSNEEKRETRSKNKKRKLSVSDGEEKNDDDIEADQIEPDISSFEYDSDSDYEPF
jgi:hypothetical protein